MSGSQPPPRGSPSHSAGFDATAGREASKAVEALREQAVAAVTEAIYQQLGDRLAAFGEAGKAYCRDDLHGHLDYLTASLVAGSAVPFTRYLAWLASVLEARGIPTESLTLSVDRLEAFFRDRLTPDQLAPVATILREGGSGLGAAGPGAKALTPPTERQPVSPEAAELADFLLKGDKEAAQAVLEAAHRQQGYLGMAVGWVEPALRRVGELWQERKISVADEHLATAHAQRLLTEQFTRAEFRPPDDDHRALFACVPTNQHEVGLRVLADSFELAGWRVEFLGADTPIASLVDRVEQFRPEVVGLSVSLARQIPRLVDAVEAMREAFGDDCPRLVAGGPGLRGLPGAAAQLGLEACYAQPQDALEELT